MLGQHLHSIFAGLILMRNSCALPLKESSERARQHTRRCGSRSPMITKKVTRLWWLSTSFLMEWKRRRTPGPVMDVWRACR